MRKIILGLIVGVVGLASIAVGVGRAAPATPTFIQQVSATPGSGSAVTVPYSSAQTAAQRAGDLNIVAIGFANTTSTIVSVTDNKGNAYAVAAPLTRDSLDSQAVYYAKNIATGAGNTVVTVTFNNSVPYPDIRVVEYSGVDKVAPLDVTKSATGSGTTANSGAVTTTNANNLIFGAGLVSSRYSAAGSGFTKRIITADGNIAEDRNVTTTGSYSATASCSSGKWIMQLVAFKADPGTPDTTPPSIPTGLQATAVSTNLVSLNWAASTDNIAVAGYQIYRDGALLATTSSTSYQDLGVSPGTSYRYTLAAYDQAGNISAQSSPTLATTPASDTTAPTVTLTSPTDSANLTGTIAMSAEATDDTAVTKVEFYVDDQLKQTDSIAPFSFNFDTTSMAFGAHSFVAKAYDAAGNSALSSSVTAYVDNTDYVAPSTPTGLRATTASSTSITLSWAASTDNIGVTGYKVYRDGTEIATTIDTAYQNTGLTAETTYSYTVSATDAAGNESPQSEAASATTTAITSTAFPLKLSTSGRYLVDQNNKPFLLTGDSPQGLVVRLPLNGPGSSEEYFANREARGFNAAWVNLLARDDNGGTDDGYTFDGIAPFLPQNDLATPNTVYFQRAHDMIAQAAAHHILVILDPIETIDHLQMLRSNGANKAFNYGAWLGNYFKDLPNIIWMSGNDYAPNASDNALTMAVVQGIQSTDRADRLQTVELYPTPTGSLADPAWTPYINLDLAYTYAPAYAQVLTEYNRALNTSHGTMPTIMIESYYDFENIAPINNHAQPDSTYRNQEYWTALSGAAGQVYGNYYTVRFPISWNQPSHLDTPAVTQLGYLTNLLGSYKWYDLVPDQNGSFLTSGQGEYIGYIQHNADGSIKQNDYITAALTTDGSTGFMYLPTPRTITVNMSKLSGQVTARWFDPTTNTFTDIGTFANSGSRQFTPPSVAHADGARDWLLVLTTEPPAPDTTAPVITGVGATGITASTATVTWDTNELADGQVEYGLTPNYGTSLPLNTTPSTTHNQGLSDLLPRTTYHYRVTSRDSTGNLSASSDYTFTTTDITVATPQFIQTAAATADNSASSISKSFTAGNNAGNLIAVAVSWDGTSSAPTCSDSQGNTYFMATYQRDTVMNQSLAICYAPNSKAGTNAVTVTFSGNQSYRRLIISEYSGVATVSPVDITAQNISVASTAANAVTSGSATTTVSGNLIFGAVMDDSATTSITAGSGFTQRAAVNNKDMVVQDMVQGASGTIASTQTFGAAHRYLAQMVAFRAQ